MTLAWINGLLSQIDPRTYPKLESLIDTPAKAAAPAAADPAEAGQNLRMWGLWLKTVNRKLAPQSQHSAEPESGN